MRIENLTDQIEGFADEIANCINRLEKKGFNRQDAIKITELAIKDMEVETKHEKNGMLKYIANTLECISNSLDRD